MDESNSGVNDTPPENEASALGSDACVHAALVPLLVLRRKEGRLCTFGPATPVVKNADAAAGLSMVPLAVSLVDRVDSSTNSDALIHPVERIVSVLVGFNEPNENRFLYDCPNRNSPFRGDRVVEGALERWHLIAGSSCSPAVWTLSEAIDEKTSFRPCSANLYGFRGSST